MLYNFFRMQTVQTNPALTGMLHRSTSQVYEAPRPGQDFAIQSCSPGMLALIVEVCLSYIKDVGDPHCLLRDPSAHALTRIGSVLTSREVKRGLRGGKRRLAGGCAAIQSRQCQIGRERLQVRDRVTCGANVDLSSFIELLKNAQG